MSSDAPALVPVPFEVDGEVDDGVVTACFIDVGDTVTAGAPIIEVAVDKADVAVPAPVTGVVVEVRAPIGAHVRAGEVLATVRPGTPDADPSHPAPPPATVRSEAASPGRDRDGSPPAPEGRVRTEKLPAIRKTIARTMMHSLASTAQLTSVVPVDVTRMMALRAEIKDEVRSTHGVSVSPFTFLARATCMALQRHPAINASMSEDASTATYHDYVNLGVAVDTPRGLVVASIRDAQDRSVTDLARAIAEVAGRARSGDLRPDDVRGATFTISNTGSNGTLMGTPILNPPQAAILATYAVQRRPVVTGEFGSEAIAIRSVANLALTYDHRLVDGADAARFLQDVRWLVEEHDLREEL